MISFRYDYDRIKKKNRRYKLDGRWSRDSLTWRPMSVDVSFAYRVLHSISITAVFDVLIYFAVEGLLHTDCTPRLWHKTHIQSILSYKCQKMAFFSPRFRDEMLKFNDDQILCSFISLKSQPFFITNPWLTFNQPNELLHIEVLN